MTRIIVIAALLLPAAAQAQYACNTHGGNSTIGVEVVATGVPYSGSALTEYYYATLRCRETDSATHEGVVERVVSTRMEASPQGVAAGLNGVIDLSRFRILEAPCYAAYYFIHQDYRGRLSNRLDGEPVTLDFSSPGDYPVSEIREAPFNATFTGGFSVDASGYTGWSAPAAIGGDWRHQRTTGDGQVCRTRSYPQTCALGQGPSGIAGNPLDLLSRRKRQVEPAIPVAGPDGLGYSRLYLSPAPDGADATDRVQGRFTTPGEGQRIERLPETPPAYRIIGPQGRGYIVAPDAQGRLHADSPRRPVPTLEPDGGYTLTRPDGHQQHFDPQGRLLRETRADGRERRYRYENGRLTAITGAFGRQLTFSYDTDGRLTDLHDPAGQAYHYDYDADGRLIRLTYPDSATREYRYDDPADPRRLTGIRNENGDRYATYTYNAAGEAIQSTHAGGAGRRDIDYPDATRVDVRQYTDPAAERYALHRYQLTPLDGAPKITRLDTYECGRPDACTPRTERWEYDARGRLQRHTAPDGLITEYEYNAQDLEIRRLINPGSPQAVEITTDWDPDTRQRTHLTRPGETLDYRYDSAGHLSEVTRTDRHTGAQRTTRYRYGDKGLLLEVDGPRTDVQDITRYAYDAQGNRTEITNALGHTTRITAHDAAGRPLTLIDPNGLTTRLAYDVRGRLIEQERGGRLTRYRYDPAGHLIQLTRPDGRGLAFAYDAAGRLIGLEDTQGNRIAYTLDAAGNRLEESVHDPSGALVRTRRRLFDTLSRLIESLGADGQSTRYAYDPAGTQTRTTDPLGRTTETSYDPLGRLAQSLDPLGGQTTTAYDAQDRPTAVTDPNGHTTTYDYDGLGQRIARHSPDTGATTTAYDAAGNLTRRTDANGHATTYTYDALNRLTAVHTADSALDVTLTYDEGPHGIGRLTRIRDAHGTTDLTYNAHGQPLTKTRTAQDGSGLVTTFTWEYDSAGRLGAMTYPSGHTLRYGYRQNGPLQRLDLQPPGGAPQPLVANIQYLPFGPLQAYDYGNGLRLTRRFDQDYRLIEQSLPGLQHSRYAYDPAGNITDWRELAQDGRDQQFVYDALDRLTDASGAYGPLSYRYDAAGNRLSYRDAGGTQTYRYAPDSHHLLEISGSAIATDTRTYDAAGNTLQRGQGAYTYNAAGRLARFSQGDTHADYAYNGQGERVRKTVNGRTTRFRYGAGGRLLGEYSATGQPLREYLYLGDTPVALLQGGRTATQPPTLLTSLPVNHVSQPLALGGHDSAPVLIAGPLTTQGGQGAVAALSDIGPHSATVRLREWNHLDGAHYRETLSLLALPPGRHPQADGSLWEVGRFRLGGTKGLHDIAFREPFPGTPALFLTQQTQNDGDTTVVRARRVNADGFQAALFEQESLQDGHPQESIGYLAIYSPAQAGTARFHGTDLNYQLSRIELNHNPLTVGDQQLRLQEERSLDSETSHTLESVDLLQLEGHLFAQDVSLAGWDTAVLRRDGPTPPGTLQGQAGSAVIYLHTDHRGAVVKATDAAQTLVWDVKRKPFGERHILTAQVEIPLGYPGQYFDEESGLYYNYFRDYDPSTGRYVESDPIGLVGGLNTYAYALGNPVRHKDPSGLIVPAVVAACLADPPCAAAVAAGIYVTGKAISEAIQNWNDSSDVWDDVERQLL